MPTVNLKPTGQTDVGSVIASGAVTDVDEGLAAADGNLEASIVNSWSGNAVIFDLEDLPGDADSINTVALIVRARVDNQVDDSATYEWSVDGTGMAGYLAVWVAAVHSGNGLENFADGTGTESPTVANVNAAQIRVSQIFSQSMGPDGITHSWDTLELQVDYSVAALAFPYHVIKQVRHVWKTLLTM